MDWAFLASSMETLWRGVPMTLNLTAASVALGTLLAIGIAMCSTARAAPLRAFGASYLFLFRGTPLLVQIYLIYFGLGQFHEALKAVGLWTFFREPYWCALLALSLNLGAYGSEIIRGSLQALPKGQIEAARATGMSGFLLARRIIAPIALRQALPAYSNEIILAFKATSLASIITIMDITGFAYRLIQQTYRALDVLICAGILYLAITLIITQAVGWLEWYLSAHRRAPRPVRPTQTEAVQ